MHVNDQLQISDEGLELIRHFEGCYTVKYMCPAGVPTIGYGHTRSGVEESPITRARADQLLREDMPIYEAEIKGMVNVPLTQHEFDALVSLAFNVGGTKLARSRTIAELNAGNYSQMKVEWAEWRKADGVVMPGLVRRREAEIDMFSGIDWRAQDLKQPQVVDVPPPAPEVGPGLRVGTRHPAVAETKAALRRIGYHFDEESYFSGAAAEALERFQRDRGLRTDGVFGRKTAQALLDALNSAKVTASTIPSPQASIASFPNGNDAAENLQGLVASFAGTSTGNELLGMGLQILTKNPKLAELSTLIPALIDATHGQQTNSSAGSIIDIAGTAASIFFPAAGPIIALAKTFAGQLFQEGKIQKSDYDEVMRSIDQMERALALMTTQAQRGYQYVMKMDHTQVTNAALANGWASNTSAEPS